MPSDRSQARLLYRASESDANMLWATRFFAPDPFIFIEKSGRRYLVMSDLEVDRARDQAAVDKVLLFSDYVRRLQDRGVRFPTVIDVLPEVLKDLKINTVLVPSTFPLRRQHVHHTPGDPDPLQQPRLPNGSG